MGVRWGGSGAIVSRSAWGVNANGGSVAIALLAGVVARLAVVRSALSAQVASINLPPKRDRHSLASARLSRDRRMADGQRDHCSCTHPPKIKRKVHMIPPIQFQPKVHKSWRFYADDPTASVCQR